MFEWFAIPMLAPCNEDLIDRVARIPRNRCGLSSTQSIANVHRNICIWLKKSLPCKSGFDKCVCSYGTNLENNQLKRLGQSKSPSRKLEFMCE
jgi:hypothetical protein